MGFLALEWVGIAAAVALVAPDPVPAQAGPARPARDMVKEARIWKDLEAVAPEALATFKEATAAF
ncbi:MAG: hypothetical protein L0323_24510, partial [Planctomycetes bacterium]|nr:hypothetical protein [Planctomycetota bacterium]